MDFINLPPSLLQIIVFCIFVALIVYVTRIFVEFYPPILANKKINHFWTELFLPTFPIFIGGLIGAFVNSYPYPTLFVDSQAGRIFFGASCGFISGWIYRIVKNYFMKLIKSTAEGLQNEEKSKE